MPKHRRKRRPPKRSLALPDLEQTKSAVLNSLTSKSVSERMIMRLMNLSTGTARNRDSLSIARLFFGTEFIWNNDASHQQQSTFAWPRSGVWRTRQPIPASSVPSWPPAYGESKVYAGSACDWVTGSQQTRAARCC